MELVVRPRGGLWRLRDFYEVLAECRAAASGAAASGGAAAALARASPSSCGSGGFRIPRTELGWHAMLRAAVATPRIQFGELSPEQRDAAAADLRFSVACGALPWRPSQGTFGDGGKNDVGVQDRWIDEMPEDPKFEVNSLDWLPFEEKVVHISAYNHVEDHHLLAIVKALEACGHSVQQTSGFKMDKGGNLLITGSKARRPTHKGKGNTPFGLICAHATVAEERVMADRRRLGLPPCTQVAIGAGRAAQERLQQWSPAQRALACGPDPGDPTALRALAAATSRVAPGGAGVGAGGAAAAGRLRSLRDVIPCTRSAASAPSSPAASLAATKQPAAPTRPADAAQQLRRKRSSRRAVGSAG